MSSIRQSLYVPTDFLSLDYGAPDISEIGSSGLRALQMDLAADKVGFITRIPFWLAPEQPLGVKIHWTAGSTTSADTIDWDFWLDFIDEDDQIAQATSVLDTVIAQDIYGGGSTFLNKITSRGIRNADFLTRLQVEAGAKMIWRVGLNATDINLTTEKVWLLGIEFDYIEIDYVGDTSLVDYPNSSIRT